MTNAEQEMAKACAKAHGWKIKSRWYVPESPATHSYERDYWHDGEVYKVAVEDYHPGLDDPQSLKQADDLKKQLISLGYGWTCEFVEASRTYWFRISRIPYGLLVNANHNKTEGLALCQAVMKMGAKDAEKK